MVMRRLCRSICCSEMSENRIVLLVFIFIVASVLPKV